MKHSNLYRINPATRTLHNVQEVNFSDHNFKERYDIQEWIETKPSILGEKLLIIAKEQAIFEGTKERPDLIAIDTEGNIVIIELKRDDSGADVHWQAIKYASYWSRFSADDIVNTYLQYLQKYHKAETDTVDEDYARQKIFDFVDADTLNSAQRIILVSHRFSREVISAVEWLIEQHKLDIRCFELIPYLDESANAYYLQAMLLLPVIGIDNKLVKPSIGKPATSANINRNKNNDEVTKFFESFKEQLIRSLKPEEAPTKFSRWAGTGTWFRYYHLWYKKGLWDNWNLSYKIWLYNNHPSNNGHKNEFQVLLSFYGDYLRQQGIGEMQIKALTTLLENVAKEIGFSIKKNEKNKNEFSIGLYSNTGITDNSAIEKILSATTSLISKTYAPVNEILNQNAEISQETPNV